MMFFRNLKLADTCFIFLKSIISTSYFHIFIMQAKSTMLYFSGIHQHHQLLTLKPRSCNAMCCDDRYMYIMQSSPPLLSLYGWAGNHLHDVDHNQLGLGRNNPLCAVGSADRSLILAVATESYLGVSSLVKYSIRQQHRTLLYYNDQMSEQ